MSRRKHKTRTATPPAPAPPAVPANRAAEPARTDVYHDSLPIRHRHAGGVDLGLRSHWAAAPPLPDGTPQVKEFDTYTDSLEALADWLQQRGVTTVALEATGVYWEPLFAILEERGFEVLLVAPKYTSGIQGRPKTDRLDCQWIQRLHAHGLLPASFRPPAGVAVLRHYLRQRAELVRNGARHIQHMQKALEQMNLKLPEVLSDITGLTGRKVITAILAGERDPLTLARLRDKHCRNSTDTIARALRGSWRPEALFALRQAWDSWQHYQGQLRAVEAVIQQQLHRLKKSQELPPLPPKPRQRGRQPNDPRFEVRAALYYVTGVDLTELEGIADVTALVVVSEVGLDMSRFPTVKHFCAWLGLCPLVKQSGRTKKGQKKILSARTRRGRGRAAQALCLAASSLWQNRSALGAFLRRLKARLGPEKAVTATAHKLARLVYQALKSGVLPAKLSAAEYAAAQHERAVEALKKKARRLGLVVTENGAQAP
ncbi:MAG: IS110 family transposase, partial [Chloroflexota bacterium]